MSHQVMKMMREYKGMVRERSIIAQEISSFTGLSEDELIESMCFHQPEGERVQTGLNCDRLERIALDYADRLQRTNREWLYHLYSKYQELTEELSFFEKAIRSLPEDLSGIMWDIVTTDLTWDSIAESHNVSRSSIGYKRKKAVEELDRMYFNRDRLYAEYVVG